MYCSNCGTRNEGNKFCIHCGIKLENINSVSSNEVVKKEEKSGLKTASIVLGIIAIVSCIMIVFSPMGIILSLIGLIIGIIANKKVRNVLGIVLNSVGLFLSIVIISLLIWFVYLLINDNNDYVVDEGYNYDDFYDYNYDDFGNYDNFFDEFFGEEYDEFFGEGFNQSIDEKPNNEYY